MCVQTQTTSMGDQGFGRVSKDLSVNNLSVQGFEKPALGVFKDIVADRIRVKEIFAIDSDDTTGNLVQGPVSSQENQIASFSGTDGATLQSSKALADTDGTISATGVFIGADPADSSGFTNGIFSDGTFVATSATLADWSLDSGWDATASTLTASRIGQLVVMQFDLVTQGAFSGDGLGPRVVVAPSGYLPIADQSVPFVLDTAGTLSDGYFQFNSSNGHFIVFNSGGAQINAGAVARGSLTYIAAI